MHSECGDHAIIRQSMVPCQWWRGALGFSVLAIFQISYSVFAPKNFFVFQFWCSLRFADFSVFQHLVFGFREKYQRVFGFDIRCSFWLFLFDLFGFRFLYALCGKKLQMLSRGMHDKPIEISLGSLRSLRVAVPSPLPQGGGRGGEGTATRRLRLSTEHCQSFFINATSKQVTKLQATCD